MLNLYGKSFGRLTTIKIVGSSKNKRKLWLCMCACGTEVVVESTSLVLGNTKSCGCLQREMGVKSNIDHGDCGTRLYRIWKGMLARCNCPGSTDYKWYGEKGVNVCKEWKDYKIFRKWSMENGYSDSLTIDRINTFGNYEPHNCKWSTASEQNSNRRCSRRNAT